jgi:hypothetical protein
MITQSTVLALWFPSLIILLTNFYFTNFYSVIFTQNIEISNEKNIIDIIKIQSDTVQKKYEENVITSPVDGNVEDEFIMQDESVWEIPNIKFQAITDDEVQKLISYFYCSNWISKLYDSTINVVCGVGGLITLIFLLIISFDQTGLINFVYILFCLYHIYNFRKFMQPNQYSLPQGLKFIKIFVYLDLLLNIAYQVPMDELHKADGTKNWQKVIGIFSFSFIDEETKELEFKNIGTIVSKSLMF